MILISQARIAMTTIAPATFPSSLLNQSPMSYSCYLVRSRETAVLCGSRDAINDSTMSALRAS